MFIKYSNGTIVNVWQNTSTFNGSQSVSGSFTTPATIASFQVGTAVTLDKGYLDFSGMTLTAFSNALPSAALPITAGDTYQFTGQVTGGLAAPLGQGGRIVAAYASAAGQSAGEDLLWQNPTNFNGTVPVQQTVTANANAATLRLALTAVLDAGHLDFGDFNRQRLTAGAVIRRSTYMLAGTAVAVRVTGDPDGNNGLHYLYSDHLGSASAMQKSDGSAPIITRYLPFGGYRAGSGPNEVTDRGFTGQPENMSLGLYYYQARFYVPGIGRFASADTIVPDPANPQSYNRYSYTLNNPVRFSDPTGHFTEEAITQYLQDNHDDWETVLAAWMNDAEWWATLLAASAGDVIFGSVTQSFWDGAQMLMPVYYHFAGEGQDVLSGVAYSLSAFIMENAAYGNTPFGMMTLNNIFQGNNGVTWGGLYQKDTHGHIVNVLHRMSVTSIYQHLGGAGGSSLKDNLYGELQEAFACSFIGGGAAGGLGCAVALPFAGNLVNNWVWPNFFAGPGFAIQEGYLSHGDYIYVSAGHVFAYHTVASQSDMRRTDYMTVSFFGTTGIYPFYQLTVDYVYR